ncbi:Rieske (2Fe-2S) protein [Sorangium sp. So ce131]|uniref:Rieske (2Fe-2S) protein n=1 Tax=Sorangium sp. So ce131 TaxID=3133282 RepID=UPI003F63CF05
MSEIMLDEMTVVNLGPLAQIPPGEGRAFDVGGLEIAVFRTRAGEVFAVQARCPHRGGPLADGLLGGKNVQCPLHGIVFDLPTGRPIGAECSALERFRVELSASEDILLHLGRPGSGPSPWLHERSETLVQLRSDRGMCNA